MIQLAFLATTMLDGKTYVAIYTRSEHGHVGPRWVKGPSALFGESLTGTKLISSDDELSETFWNSAPFSKTGKVTFHPLGVGVSKRQKKVEGRKPDVRRHVFVIYRAELSELAQVSDLRAESMDELMSRAETAEAAASRHDDYFSGFVPAAVARATLSDKLMEQCAISLLIEGTAQDVVNGPSRAFLVPGEISGSRAGVVQRVFADIERAVLAFNGIVALIVFVAFLPGLMRLVMALFK